MKDDDFPGIQLHRKTTFTILLPALFNFILFSEREGIMKEASVFLSFISESKDDPQN
jgi:hypothetical protein